MTSKITVTADDFTTAARAEADRRWSRDQEDGRPLSASARMNRRIGFDLGALWARAHLAAQEPTDAECIHVLSVLHTDLGQPTRKDFEWSQAAIQRCRNAIMAARDVRGQG